MAAGHIDYTSARFWFDVSRAIFTIAIAVYVYFATRKKAVDERFRKMEAHISEAIKEHRSTIDDRCEKRLDRINSLDKADQQMAIKMESFPSSEDLKDMAKRIDETREAMKELTGRLTGINRAVDLINEYLLNKGK